MKYLLKSNFILLAAISGSRKKARAIIILTLIVVVIFATIAVVFPHTPYAKWAKAEIRRDYINALTSNYWNIPPEDMQRYLEILGVSDNEVNPAELLKTIENTNDLDNLR